MKIHKFNESIMSDKIDNLYKKSILYECVELEQLIINKKHDALEFINDYIQNNDDFKKNHTLNYNYKTPSDGVIIDFKFEKSKRYSLVLIESRSNIGLTQKETLDLLKYLSDTALLKNMKKYNI